MAAKRQKTSKVWEYFKRLESDSDVECSMCKQAVKVKDGATTNLHNHLRRKHNI